MLRDMEAQKHQLKMYDEKGDHMKTIWIQGQVRMLPLGVYEYIFPKIADFGTESNAEVMKIHFYKEKFTSLLDELQLNSDWYDYDNNGSISVQEFKPIPTNYQRIR